MTEALLQFGDNRRLVGICSEPADPGQHRAAAIVLNAGLLHRVGPNRFHVTLSRRLAAMGIPALRFDFSGIGDSLSARSSAPFPQRASGEIEHAMDALHNRFGIRAFTLIGICSGADVALETALENERVTQAVVINGGFFGAGISEPMFAEARARLASDYYRRHLGNLESWARFFRKKNKLRRILQTASMGLFRPARLRGGGSHIPEPISEKIARLKASSLDVLAIFSPGSITWELAQLIFGPRLRGLGDVKNIELKYVDDCDHLFTLRWSQEKLLQTIEHWMRAKSEASVKE